LPDVVRRKVHASAQEPLALGLAGLPFEWLTAEWSDLAEWFRLAETMAVGLLDLIERWAVIDGLLATTPIGRLPTTAIAATSTMASARLSDG
jgi:hypothetical protein